MNLAQLRREVMDHQVAPNVYTGRVNALLNEALRRIARQIHYYAGEADQQITTTAGQAAYPWPADFGKLRYVVDTVRGRTLRHVPLRTIDEQMPDRGTPAAYALSRSSLMLYPTPAGTGTLLARYWALPPLMATDEDVPAIPDDYHRLLPLWALKRSFEVEDDLEMATYWRREWDEGLRELEVDVRFPTDDGPRQVPDMWEGYY